MAGSGNDVIQCLKHCLIVHTYTRHSNIRMCTNIRGCVIKLVLSRATMTLCQKFDVHIQSWQSTSPPQLQMSSSFMSRLYALRADNVWQLKDSRLTLLRLKSHSGVDAVCKDTCCGLAVVGCDLKSEVNRAQTKWVGRRVYQ